MVKDDNNKIIFCPFCDKPDVRFAGFDMDDVSNYVCDECNRYWNIQILQSKMNTSFWKEKFSLLRKSS